MKPAVPTVVFLGPSLALAAARRMLDATYLPPAAMGDVYRALARRPRPRRIALIDGYFERMAAPWHKELLWAMERGVTVYGAASMGALRAAELEAYGMIGVGRIFADYRRGRLTDDDEVAVLHGPGERDFAPASDAMVSLRAGLAAARAAGAISARSHDALVGLAKAMFYRDRRWDSVAAAGAAAGVPPRQLAALAAHLRAHPVDAKAADARALLRRLAREPTPPQRSGRHHREPMARTWFWHRFVEIVDLEP